MSIYASDSFAGLTDGQSIITSRNLDNALGGSGTRSWVTNAVSGMQGNGAGRVKGASANAYTNLLTDGQDYKARIEFDPAGGTSVPHVAVRKGAASGNTTWVCAVLSSSHTVFSMREGDGASSGPSHLNGTVRDTETITAPATPFAIEVTANGQAFTAELIRLSDSAVLSSLSYTYGGSAPTGTYLSWGFSAGGNTGTFDNFTVDDLAGGDVTAPVLTSAVGTETGSTTATVGATTDEDNGTMYVSVTTSATQPSIAQIKAGQDHTGAAAAFADDQVITTTGAKTFNATGLTASTTYYAHLVHTDAAANDSNRISSAGFTTDSVDTTAPTLTSPTAVSISNVAMTGTVSTDEANGTLYMVATTSATPPTATQIRAGQDHTGAAAVFAANQAIGSTGVKTFNVTGLTALTTYHLYYHHRDASNNDSTVSTASDATFRDGDTAANIIANTAPIGDGEPGFLYALALTKDADDWLSWYEVTPPDPSGGTLDANPDGSFTYNGPSPATWVIQAETNGVEEAETTEVTLYDQPDPGDETAPVLTSPTGAALGAFGAVGSISTDEANGTLYWLTTINATELEAAVEAGSSQAVTTTGVQNVTSSGLTPETDYYNHYFQRDLAGNPSNVISSAMFTTPADTGPVESSNTSGRAMRSAMRQTMWKAMN